MEELINKYYKELATFEDLLNSCNQNNILKIKFIKHKISCQRNMINDLERVKAENTPTSSEQLAAPDVMHWVSVSERLPKIGTITDVYTTAGHRVTNYTWENHDLQSSFKPHEITHWIAIPEPPCA